MIAKIIGGFIALMVGAVLLPEFANQSSLIQWTVEEQAEKPHRQTYLEYVKERLEVERLMKRSWL